MSGEEEDGGKAKKRSLPKLPEYKIEPKPPDAEYAKRVIDHINEKAVAPNDACPVCGSSHNNVIAVDYQLNVRPAKGAMGSGRMMPLTATLCQECGFVRLFSTMLLREKFGMEEAEGNSEEEEKDAS